MNGNPFLFAGEQDILNWFRVKNSNVATGDLNATIRAYMITKGGVRTTGNIKEMLLDKMRGLGFGSGDLAESLNKFFLSKMGGTDAVRAQQLFFVDTSKDFA